MAITFLKPRNIFRKHNNSSLHLWPRRHCTNQHGFHCSRRLSRSPLLLLPHPLPLPPHSLPLRHCLRLHPAPLPPLLRFRLHPLCHPMSSLTGDGTTPEADKTVRVVMKGRVQGVFYRDWTVSNAKELGLKGWVRNRRDGSVEALFSGSPDKVQDMEERCRRGPPSAMVTGLQVFPCSDDPGTTFERKQTA